MQNIARQLYENHATWPDRVAVILLHSKQPDQEIWTHELWRVARQYASTFQLAGIQPGEVIILILQPGEALIYAFFGAVLHGAVPSILPFLTEKLSPEAYRRSLVALFGVTAPAAVVTYPEFEAEVHRAVRQNQTGGQESIRVILSTPPKPGAGSEAGNANSGLFGLEQPPSEIALLQHSSGTTGLQKGVALSHQAVFNQLDPYCRAIDLRQDDVVVSWLPLYHDMGLIAGFILPILRGVPLVLMGPLDWVRAPQRLLQAVSRYRGTLTWLPNFAYNFCAQKIRDADLDGVDLSSWRAVINCSEPMYLKSHQLFQRRFEPYGLQPDALATCYAMAENVFAVSQGGICSSVNIDWISQPGLLQQAEARPPVSGEAALPMLSAGRPLENTRLRILGEDGQDLPERRVSEIALQSDCMLTGYYNRPDETARAFREGWYLTGDLGYLAGGEIYVTGRKKDLIIVGGTNIYPQDLEALASEVEGVHPGRVAAFGIPDEESGTEEVVLVAEVEEGDIPPGGSRELIAEEIRRRITRGSPVALRRVVLVERGWLVKTSSGKVARRANRDKYLSGLFDTD